VEELSALIRQHTIRAPFRARAGLSDTHLGQYLPAGTSITTLQSLDGYLLVDFMLPQHVADVMHVGDVVRLDATNQAVPATIVAFDAMADRGSRNLRARARIDSPPDFMQPGDSVRVAAEFGPEMETPVVPVQALRRSPDGALVYVAQADAAGQMRARARPVQAGPTVGNLVRILAGLQPDEQVIADGSFKLREGTLIVDANATPPPSKHVSN
jgi:membrane fusion protein (multidrug efflux system)